MSFAFLPLAFRLAAGLCLKSYAFHCAESFGIPKHIIERAMKVSTALSTFNIIELMDPEMSEADEQELRESEAIVKRVLKTKWLPDEEENEEDLMEGKSAMTMLAGVLRERYEE